MNSIIVWLEKHVVPFASKLGSYRPLIALRNGVTSLMPLILVGTFAVLVNNTLLNPDVMPGDWTWDNMPKFVSFIRTINGNVWWGTLAILALALAFSLSYQIAAVYDEDGLPAGIVGLGAFIAATSQTSADGAWGNLPWTSLNAGGLFTAIILSAISVTIYLLFKKRNITIKMPDSVPPAVSKSFAAIIPGLFAIYATGILAAILTEYDTSFQTLIYENLQRPFRTLGNHYVTVLVLSLLIPFFWFFGIHGGQIFSPLLDGLYMDTLATNIDLFAGKVVDTTGTLTGGYYIVTKAWWDSYVFLGGAGATLGLLIAIILMSKREDYRSMGKLGVGPGIFQINEPVIFGLPIVLNPILFIPFILATPIMATVAYLFTISGIIPPTVVAIPWVTPVGIGAFLATGAQGFQSVLAAAVALLNLAISVIIYIPFVVAANKVNKENS